MNRRSFINATFASAVAAVGGLSFFKARGTPGPAQPPNPRTLGSLDPGTEGPPYECKRLFECPYSRELDIRYCDWESDDFDVTDPAAWHHAVERNTHFLQGMMSRGRVVFLKTNTLERSPGVLYLHTTVSWVEGSRDQWIKVTETGRYAPASENIPKKYSYSRRVFPLPPGEDLSHRTYVF